MMADSLVLRYVEPVPVGSVPRILTAEVQPATESLGDGIQESVYLNLLDTAERARLEAKGGIARDGELAELVHRAFSGLGRRDLTDPRLWQWLTTVPFREYVIGRWAPECASDPAVAFKPSVHQRFCGSGSLGGVARNALGRLFWVADATAVDDDYDLTRRAFANPDLLVGIFERRLGLEPRLARSCIANLDKAGESVHRMALRIVNYSLSTVVVEALSDAEVDTMVVEAVALAQTAVAGP
jgi:hypothetical protein